MPDTGCPQGSGDACAARADAETPSLRATHASPLPRERRPDLAGFGAAAFGPALGRVRQFLVLSRTRATPADLALARRYLGPAELALWRRQSARDQGHSARVLRRLLAAGERDPALLRAALLHDTGKSLARVTLAHRIALVLLQAAGEPWLSRLARSNGPGPLRALDVLNRHAALGAALAEQAGSGLEVADLIRRHDGPTGGDPRLRRLRQADRD